MDDRRENRRAARNRRELLLLRQVVEAQRVRAGNGPRRPSVSSDSEDVGDSDDSLDSLDSFIDEEGEEEDDWEQDWESDSQEFHRPLSSGSDSEGSSSNSGEDSIVVLDDTLPRDSNSSQDLDNNLPLFPVNQNQTEEIAPSTSRDMPADDHINVSNQEDAPSRSKRPRIDPVTESQEPTTSVKQEDGAMDDNCTICYDEYTTQGEHRLVSLKCGHFFGKSCIEKWVKGVRAATCPTCKQKAHIKDLRVHFAMTTKMMVDTSALEELRSQKSELERINSGLEMELAKTKRELKECQRKFQEAGDPTRLLSVIQSPGQMSFKLGSRLRLATPSRQAGARSFDYNGTYFAVGVQYSSLGPVAPHFGIRKININPEGVLSTSNEGLRLHSQRCRVITFSPFQSNLVLSGGEDEKVIIHSIDGRGNPPKIWNIPERKKVWCACWLSPTTFAVGCSNGRIYEFDTLREEPVKDISQGIGNIPIISLTNVPGTNIVVACSMRKLIAYRNDNAYPLIDSSETIRAIAWDHSTKSFVATFMSSRLSHKWYALEIEERAIHSMEIGVWKTPYKNCSTMWNNCLFTLSAHGTFSVIYNEDAGTIEAHDWIGHRKPASAPFKFPENAYDMKVIPAQDGGKIIAVLTENEMFTFIFNISV